MADAPGFATFSTAIGECGLAWSAGGVVGVQLPEGGEARTRERLMRRFPKAERAEPPPKVGAAIEGVVALLRGEARDLTEVALDFGDAPVLHRRVWALARAIPPGGTRSYGDIATELGDPLLAREVGQALGRNPIPIIVPCHRVLAAGGKIGGFSAHGGVTTKRRLLAIESVLARGEPDLFRA